MKKWETICNIEKNNKLDTIFSRKRTFARRWCPPCSALFALPFAGPAPGATVRPRLRPWSHVSSRLCSWSFAPLLLRATYLLLRHAHWFWSLFFSRSKAQPHHPPVDGRSSILVAESSLHTGCTEYTPAFDYSVICLRARTESPNMPAFETLTCTALTGGVRA